MVRRVRQKGLRINDDERKKRNQKIYKKASGYLKQIVCSEPGIEPSQLDKYLKPNTPTDLEGVFECFIFAAQDSGQMHNSIKFDERKDVIKSLLQKYGTIKDIAKESPEKLFDLFCTSQNEFKISTTHNRNWHQWCGSIIDSAKFLDQFRDYEEFDQFVKGFGSLKGEPIQGKRTPADMMRMFLLPLYLQTTLRGFGLALACNALKETGYTDYPKPDTQLMQLFESLKLWNKKDQQGSKDKHVSNSGEQQDTRQDQVSDRDKLKLCEVIIELADDNGVTPYSADRVFWLLCTGDFYLDNKKATQHKANGGISFKQDFVNTVQ